MPRTIILCCSFSRKPWIIAPCRAWNSSRPLAIFRPIFPIWPSKSNLLGHIYCTFPMEKSLIVYRNVPAFKEWPTIFKFLFQALPCSQPLSCKPCYQVEQKGMESTGKRGYLSTVNLHGISMDGSLEYLFVNVKLEISWIDSLMSMHWRTTLTYNILWHVCIK